MIISLTKKFIFIHVPKTAGTTISMVLSRFCQVPPDVIPEYKDLSYAATNVFKFHNKYRGQKISKHMKISELKSIMGKDIKDFFTFSIERNPWDKAVSRFLYAKRTNHLKKYKIKNFKEFLLHSTMKSNWNFYGCGNKILVDYMGKYETLNDDLNTICQRLNIPTPKDMPHEKKTQKRKHYSKYYNQETREIVAKSFAKEIQYFGYTFEDKR